MKTVGAQKGHIVSLETRRKIGLANSFALKGHKQSAETKLKRIISLRKIVHTDEWNRKVAIGLIGKNSKPRGDKCWNWKGGISVKNPLAYKSYMQNIRRLRKTENGGSHSMTEWELLKSKHSHACVHCKKQEPIIKLTRDHIIPLSKGGNDDIGNLQPLCRVCNSRKRNKVL